MEAVPPHQREEVPDVARRTSQLHVGVLRKSGRVLAATNTLSSAMEVVEIERIVEPTVKRRSAIEVETLNSLWKQFAEQCQRREQQNLTATLLSCQPELVDNETVEVRVLNQLQAEQLKEIRMALLAHLRNGLANDYLDLLVQVPTSDEQSVSLEFLTDRERYDAFVAKNPALETLRKRMDLDLG